MAKFQVQVNGKGLLNYARKGKEAVGEVRKAITRILNVGRTTARQHISSEFGVRTGFLRRQARKMRTRATVKAAEVKGVVAPIPRLMNVFERGATLAQGRGFLRPRPVVTPAAARMEAVAAREIEAVLKRVTS